jgi:hypothetical protein
MLGIGNDLTNAGYNNYRYSLQMDGAGDVVGLGDLQTIIRGSFTINYWTRFDDSTPTPNFLNGLIADSNNQLVLGVIGGGSVNAFNFAFEADGTAVAHTVQGDLDGAGNGLSGNSQSDWFMVTLTATLDTSGSSATTFAFYSNANAISTSKTIAKAKHTAFATGTQIFTFGGRNNAGTGDSNLDGNITQFAIWNTALDADAVTALYNGGSPLNALYDSGNYDNSSALVRYYDFSQGSGTNLTDQTGNANGTILGNPIYSIDYPGS